MVVADIPADEAERIAVLRSLNILDAPVANEFEDVIEIAGAIGRAKIALISLVDCERQWFAAGAGVDVSETPRDVAFCAHAILRDDVLWVEDATTDPRFSENPSVTGGSLIRFYAGAPITVEGRKIGTVCVADSAPQPADPRVAAALRRLADMVAERFVSRRHQLLATNVLAATTDAVVSMSDSGLIAYWNDAAEALFGRSRSDALGMSLAELVAEECRSGLLSAVRRRGRAEPDDGQVQPLELIACRNDGAQFPIEVSLCSWRAGSLIRVGAIIRDVTRHVASEQRLQEAKAQAELASKAKSEFLAVMSHEMRTPLNGIVALTDVLSRTPLKAHQREMVELVQSAGGTLTQLLGDVLDLARIEARAVELRPEVISLHDTVSGALKLWELKAQQKGLALRLESDVGSDVWVQGDPLRLKQILTNLVSNALKFTEQGCILVTLRQLEEAHSFEIAVQDTGIGLSPDQANRIFRPFEQADSSITRRYGGSGLGLAISRDLASLMGGAITCDGRAGVGSTFTLTLRLAVVDAAAAQAVESVESPALHAMSVLVVDDHATNRKVVELILSDPCFDIVTAEDGAMALELFKEQPFDLVLMDMQMPNMDGLTATKLIRACERERQARPTPVIMLTANTMPEHVAAARDAGADRHLAKPITAAGLLSAMGAMFQEPQVEALGAVASGG